MKQKSINFALLVLGLTSCCRTPVKDTDAVKTSYVHQYGVAIADEQEWQERGSCGKTVQKLKNGETLVQTWQNGVLQGLSYATFPYTDVIREETFYENGEPLWKASNFVSGAPNQKEQYLPKASKVVAIWYEDGAPRANEEYYEDKLLHGQYYTLGQELESEVMNGAGTRVHRDAYGQLSSKERVQDGQVVLEERFFPNGIPQQFTPFVNGKVHGVVKTFYPAGEPKTVEEWQNGMLNGAMRIYFNGEVVATIPHVAGQKQGVEKRFRPGTEDLVEEITWKENKRHGPTIVYVDNEKLTDWYCEGKKVSKMQFMQQDHPVKSF